MKLSDLQPVGRLADTTGVKMLGYGGPGSGKTPLAITAPKPVILACESGLLSLRGCTNVPAYRADTSAKIDDFLKWWFESKEATQFETLVIDSISHMSNIILDHEKTQTKHGPAAYGNMAERVYKWCEKIFAQPNKHAYLICQQGTVDEAGVQKRRPVLPGQDLNTRIPHLFDLIAHIGPAIVSGQPKPVLALRCQSAFDVMARDRSGKLSEYEPPNLAQLFEKMLKV